MISDFLGAVLSRRDGWGRTGIADARTSSRNRVGASTSGGLSGHRGPGQHLEPAPVRRLRPFRSVALFGASTVMD